MSIAAMMALVGITMAVVAVLTIDDPQWMAGLLAEKFGGRKLPLGRTAAILVLVVIAVQAAVFLYALNALRQAFAAAARSDLADAAVGRNLGLAGIAFAINAGLMLLLPPVTSLIYSTGARPGEGFVTVQVGTGELMSLLLSGILFITGRLMALAAEIDDENRQII